MATKLGDNISYGGQKPNFERDQFASLAAAKAFSSALLDVGHTSYMVAEGKHYVWNGTEWVDKYEYSKAIQATGGSMGYIVLSRDKTFAEQVTKANTIYEIRYEFSLEGAEITIPSGCVLKFDGGSLKNGKVNYNGCYLQGMPILHVETVFNYDNEFDETAKPSNKVIYVDWFAVGDGVEDDSRALRDAIHCLHKKGATLEFGKGKTYLHGDGLEGEDGTGNSYQGLMPSGATNWPSIQAADAGDKANIGRDIRLEFVKFEYLTVEGNGATVKSNPLNGYCKHNGIFRFLLCHHLNVNGITVDGSRDARHVFVNDRTKGDRSGLGEFSLEDLDTTNSLKQAKEKKISNSGYTHLSYDECGGWRGVSNIDIRGGSHITLSNIKSVHAMMDDIVIGGAGVYIPTYLKLENCICLYGYRQCLTLSSVSEVTVEGGEYSYAGYILKNGELEENGTMPMSGIDVEADATGKASGVVIKGADIKRNKISGIVLTKGLQRALVERCKFEYAGVTNPYGLGCLYNEVKDCYFYNCGSSLVQEGLRIHHNVYEFDKNGFSENPHFDIPTNNTRLTNKDNDKYPAYITGDVTGETIYPRTIAYPEFTHNIIRCNLEGVKELVEADPTIATKYLGSVRLGDSAIIIIKNNVFKNLCPGGASSSLWGTAREYTGNVVHFDAEYFDTGSEKYCGIARTNEAITATEKFDDNVGASSFFVLGRYGYEQHIRAYAQHQVYELPVSSYDIEATLPQNNSGATRLWTIRYGNNGFVNRADVTGDLDRDSNQELGRAVNVYYTNTKVYVHIKRVFATTVVKIRNHRDKQVTYTKYDLSADANPIGTTIPSNAKLIQNTTIGTYENRPSYVPIGYGYFCTDRGEKGMMIFHKGADEEGHIRWVDASGNIIT